jgi:hypothetical protein
MVLENLSGIGFDAAIKIGSTSVNGCQGIEGNTSGLALASAEGFRPYVPGDTQSVLTYFPPNGKIVVTIHLNPCQGEAFKNVRSTDVGTALVVRSGETAFVLPISASGVPIRLGGFI